MLTPQQITELRSSAGFSATPSAGTSNTSMDIGSKLKSAASAYDQARTTALPGIQDKKPEQPFAFKALDYVNNTVNPLGSAVKPAVADVKQAASNVQSRITGTGDNAGKGAVERGFGAVSDIASGAMNVASDMIPGGKAVMGAIGKGAEATVNSLGNLNEEASHKLSQAFGYESPRDFATKDPQGFENLSATLRTVGSAGNIAGTIAGAKGVGKVPEVAAPILKEAGAVAADVSNVAGDVAGKTFKGAKELVKPSLKPEEAVKQVIQGETGDLTSASRSLKELDTTGVKTYPDLYKKIDSQIKTLAEQVDKELEKDTTLRKAQQLATQVKTAGGVVPHNYVLDGIKQLKDYYTKTNNIKGLSEMEAYEAKLDPIKGKGITMKEVNNIARRHGSELNAYNANGELASGLTKQAAENTRMGIKDVVRSSAGGKASQALDAKLSDLYATQKLVKDMVEKVNTASSKTVKQGIVPKVIGKGIEIADTLAGSPIKAIGKRMGNIGSQGTMSALELEKALEANLKAIKGK